MKSSRQPVRPAAASREPRGLLLFLIPPRLRYRVKALYLRTLFFYRSPFNLANHEQDIDC